MKQKLVGNNYFLLQLEVMKLYFKFIFWLKRQKIERCPKTDFSPGNCMRLVFFLILIIIQCNAR